MSEMEIDRNVNMDKLYESYVESCKKYPDYKYDCVASLGSWDGSCVHTETVREHIHEIKRHLSDVVALMDKKSMQHSISLSQRTIFLNELSGMVDKIEEDIRALEKVDDDLTSMLLRMAK